LKIHRRTGESVIGKSCDAGTPFLLALPDKQEKYGLCLTVSSCDSISNG